MNPSQLVGTTLEGKYAIRSVIGEGGFSVVYRGVHLLWGVSVAIKAFEVAESFDVDRKARLVDAFVQEGAILCELSERSSAICQARDLGTITLPSGEWVPYLVLEWLDGDPMDVEMACEWEVGMPPRSLRETVDLLAPIAAALGLAHERGICHLDVKPANLFAVKTEKGEIEALKLLDFGVAKVFRASRKSYQRFEGLRSVTPEYGAPEQFDSSIGPTGPWTDVFALALIAVELLTNRPALEGATHEELRASTMNPRVRPTPGARGAALSGEVEDIFARALAVDPRERYPSANELWAALRSAVALDWAREASRHRFDFPLPAHL